MRGTIPDNLTPREWAQMQHEKDMFDKQAQHAEKIASMQLDEAKLEAQWSAWLKIPVTIIKLPMYVLLGLAYCIAMARKYEPGEELWKTIK